jgi:hypothetical protein
VQSTSPAPLLRRNASRAIAHSRAVHLHHGTPAVWSGDQSGLQTEAAPWRSLMRYSTGWAQADPTMIAGAAIEGYRFHDPLVGVFTAQRLSRYFEFLRAQFDYDGARARPAFYLHGPMDGGAQGELEFFREAPQLGLTGIARILVGPRGVMAETVAYDLNVATEMLRSPRIDTTC